jgi:thiol:disulfide interchange protein
LKVSFQGCSEVAGVCYPPTQRTFSLTPSAMEVRPNEVASVSLKNQFRKQVSQ